MVYFPTPPPPPHALSPIYIFEFIFSFFSFFLSSYYTLLSLLDSVRTPETISAWRGGICWSLGQQQSDEGSFQYYYAT